MTAITIVVIAAGAVYTAVEQGGFDIKSMNIFSDNTGKNYDAESNELMKVKLPDYRSEEFKKYEGFNVSFNPQYRIPNYVIYELLGTEAEGEEARAKSFECDESVEGCPQPSDYTRSGYDRGHMAPAGDMKWNYNAMRESFFMTNICPQKHALNGGGWKRLEEKIRDWAVRDSALIVATGPVITDNMPTIGKGVSVPEKFFKAVIAPFAKPIRGIAFIYKNEGGQKIIEDQTVSIDSVEKATGLDLFYELPDDIENKIESSSNYREWNN